jgi:hypothetical protein
MAARLDTFPAAAAARYPWDQWLDGSPWALKQGEDFDAKPATVRSNARIQAEKRGGTVRTCLLDEGGTPVVVIQYRAQRP